MSRRWVSITAVATMTAAVPLCCEAGRANEACTPVLPSTTRPAWVALPGQRQLSVYVGDSTAPMAGKMDESPEGAAFFPPLGFAPGLTYRVTGGSCDATFQVPGVKPQTPEVLAVYPTSRELPENLLRFYVYFSKPMAEGNFLEFVRLENVDTGRDETGVFFDNIHELWSRDRKRITLLVDPGRVKTGLTANRERGRAFQAGGSYRLRVLPGWQGIDGGTLEEGFSHPFQAIAEDRTAVNPDAWCFDLPKPGSAEPMAVQFDEPVDHVSVATFLRPQLEGSELYGTWEIGPGERSATWTPKTPWPEDLDDLSLHIDGRFEDIAGNNLNAAMEHHPSELSAGKESRPHRLSVSAQCAGSHQRRDSPSVEKGG